MFSERDLGDALDLQRRSYRLLLWMGDGIKQGFIRFDSAHTYATLPEAARAWIDRHYHDLPANARPAREDLNRFANLFATYLQSSFQLEFEPGVRRYSDDAHCFCPICSWLQEMPHLRPKRVSAADRKKADALAIEALFAVAADVPVRLSRDHAASLVTDRSLREDLARVAWARTLIQRLDGVSPGPAVLALWRRFAWTRNGSPIKGYEPTATEIMDSVLSLSRRLRATSGAELR